MKNERYYYGIMTPDEKKAYKMIYHGLKMKALNIVVSLYLTPEDVQEIYLKVLYDNPLFYFINQTVIRMTGSIGYYILLPEYIYTPNQIESLNKEIRAVVNKVGIKAAKMIDNEFRLERYLHDCVVKSVAYDYDSLKQTDCYNAHSIIGAFLDNKAVCEGIAKAFKLLCNEFGIKCIVVLGRASADGIFTEDCYHAWNLVKVDGESYYVDVTWDNMYEGGMQHISYDYFNVTTQEMAKDHEPLGELPLCTSTKWNYFYCTKSIVCTSLELEKLIEERIDARQIMFMVNTQRGEFFTEPEIKEKTFRALEHVLMKKRKSDQKFIWMYNELHGIGKIIFSGGAHI